MIMMINERNGHKTRFKNYQKLYSHINSHQQGKRFNTPNQLIDDWFFARHSHRRVMAFYEFVSAQKINAEKKSGGKPPKFDDLDVESLLEDLCKRYCESKGYKLFEVQGDDGILHVKRTQNYPSLELSLQW
jgi:hypothetical protein